MLAQWMPTPTTTSNDTVSWDETHEPKSGGGPEAITNWCRTGTARVNEVET